MCFGSFWYPDLKNNFLKNKKISFWCISTRKRLWKTTAITLSNIIFNAASLLGFWSIYRNKNWIILKIKPYFSRLQRKEKEKIFPRKWFSVKIKKWFSFFCLCFVVDWWLMTGKRWNLSANLHGRERSKARYK